MKAMRKRRDALALSLCMAAALAVWFLWKGIPEVALALGAGSAVLMASLAVLSRRLRHARLILDTSLLTVPSVVISKPENGRMARLEKTVVSTFGVLVNDRVYRWGCEGVRGVRLNAVEIDKGRISLTFGGARHSMRIDLPHGLSDRQAVWEICRVLKHETGVTATVSGWDAAQGAGHDDPMSKGGCSHEKGLGGCTDGIAPEYLTHSGRRGLIARAGDAHRD